MSASPAEPTSIWGQPVDPNDPEGMALGGYLPLRFFTDFLAFLARHRERIEIITYDDLDWRDDYDYRDNYPAENARWKGQFDTGGRSRDKFYVLLQHDVDDTPERTMAILRRERELGLCANVMIFNRAVSRPVLEQTGRVVDMPYRLDRTALAAYAREHGFVVGYHHNAYEQACFDLETAWDLMRRDIGELRRQFDLRYLSAHGGTRSAAGDSNSVTGLPPDLENRIRWVHNRFGVRFKANYTDGALNAHIYDPEGRDLRDFVRSWRPGYRYRILTHPQYYSSPHRVAPCLEPTRWYREVLGHYTDLDCPSLWDEVVLAE